MLQLRKKPTSHSKPAWLLLASKPHNSKQLFAVKAR
jgi:hypothetical protein